MIEFRISGDLSQIKLDLAELVDTIFPAAVPTQAAPAPVAAPAAPAAPIVPPVQQQAPVQQKAPQGSAPEYTQEQLSVAGVSLMDAGKLQQLQALNAEFGIQAIMQLPKAQYGAYATRLRGLGAQI